RPIEIKRLQHEGRAFFHLRDHLALSGSDLLVPVELAPVLMLLDGEHDLARIRARALLEFGLPLAPAELLQVIERLDEALMLEGERAEAAMAAALAEFRAAASRPPSHAGRVYPADPAALTELLSAYELRSGATPLPAEQVAGVLSPHIDYTRGGPVYARGWRQAAEAVRAAQRVIVLGTDHVGSGGALTLTRQAYATPWGAFARDEPLQEALAQALGPEAAFAEELHHRSEHSIELASVWLHHVRGGEPLALTALLCGHPGPLLRDGLEANERLRAALEVLRGAVAEGALVVVAGDLAHVGPAFGDPLPFGAAERADVRAADEKLIAACPGGATAVLAEAARIDDRYRVCGLSPLALALAIMPPVRLEVAAYDQCPADEANGSFVSIAAGCFVRAAGS
ncbi:MAG TPA: AmmeMemoRadiSam system protein B, partial [Dehalococcoidia bacterium]|nr:AmmeMemoRadiSam system protein B [Dehalococcoidia bacterium]